MCTDKLFESSMQVLVHNNNILSAELNKVGHNSISCSSISKIIDLLNKKRYDVLILEDDSIKNEQIMQLLYLMKLNRIKAFIVINDTGKKEIIHALDMVSKGGKYYSRGDIEFIPGHSESIQHLNEQERKILNCLTRFMTNQEISQELFLSYATVRTYVSRIMKKLSLKNRSELTMYAIETMKMIQPTD